MATIDPEGLVTEAKLQRHDADTAAHTALATTIDDTLVPTSDTNTIRNLVSNLANRIKAATGASGWKEAPAATLASLSTMIANLATGADVTWDGKKFINHRLGITGLMDQNGYICFGPNCGSLIIQWGYLIISSGLNFGYFNYPILFPKMAVSAVLTHMNNNHVVCHSAIYLDSRSRCALYGESSFATDTKFYIIAIGY